MNLIVDVGNSFVKIAVFQGDELLERKTVAPQDLEKNLQEIFSSYPTIGDGILSSVSGIDFMESEAFRNDIKFHILGGTTKLPFKNFYTTPGTLGNDRLALVAAASKQYHKKNVLIIDAGTCLTFDFLNAEKEYLGGAISPGLKMRFKALHAFTANLPNLEPQDKVQLIGNNTKSCINSGVVLGMVKEIEGIIAEYKAHYEEITIIFTGGDAHFLSINLKNSIFANSNFLLEGLNYILEFNKTQ